MNKKIIIPFLLIYCTQSQELLCRYYGSGGNFGGGFATGALLGTGVALAATSGSRAPRDPYAAVDAYDAQQMLRERKAQDRLHREEERQEKLQQREEERQERQHKKDLKKRKREEEKNKSKHQTKKENAPTTKQPTKKQTPSSNQNKKTNKAVQSITNQSKKTTQSPEELQIEIKKLELEIAQLKHSQALTA